MPGLRKFPVWAIIIVFLSVLRAEESRIPNLSDSTMRLSHLIPDIEDGYGAAFRDVNRDGLPDLYVVCFRGLNRLLINQGPEKPFLDKTIESGLGGNLMTMGIRNLELGTLISDFDNDGDGDVVLAGWGETTRLFRNDLNLVFTDITAKLEFDHATDANACVTADVNNDGRLDLFFTDEHHGNHLLIQNARSEFHERTLEWGLSEKSVSQGASFCDVDLDGDPDLYVTNWFDPDFFYRNTGRNCFVRMDLPMTSCRLHISTNAPCFADLNNDGTSDLIVTNRQGCSFVYLNRTAPGDSIWNFEEISTRCGIDEPAVSYGCAIADFDQDGWQDVFIANIGTNRLYKNLKNGFFSRFQPGIPLENQEQSYSTGAIVGDLEGDGDPDLFVANKDTFSLLYENTCNDSTFIRFIIQGVRSNRDGIGTRIVLFQSGHLDELRYLIGFREVQGGGGYLSMNDLNVHFGIGSFQEADARIRFPSGREVIQKQISPATTLIIYEEPASTRWFWRSLQTLERLVHQPAFWYTAMCFSVYMILLMILMHVGRNRYRWPGRDIALVSTGFLGFAMVIIILFDPFPLLFKLFIMDGFAILFWAALLLFNERIHRLHQDRDKYKNMLVELGSEIATIHDDRILLDRVVQELTRFTGFSRCCVVLFGQKSAGIEQTYCQGCNLDHAEVMASCSGNILEKLFEKKVLLINEHSETSLFRACQADVLVLVGRDRIRGMLTLGALGGTKAMNNEDRALFSALCSQLSVALENNLYLRQSNEMIKELTESKVRKTYLDRLEKANKTLDQKNKALGKLFNELKETESQLVQSEKMASLGQLVAGISHELNNPVGFIYANLKQIQSALQKIRESEDDNSEFTTLLSDAALLIDDAIKGSHMVKTLVDHLRRFSHLDQAEYKLTNIHEGLETCLMILHPQMGDRISIHRDFRSSGMIECNIGQMNQVFLNVLSNAVQSITGHGDIWISTEDMDRFVQIRIRDNGSGIARENLTKIFDPFFTTKEVGKGIGLGLSISYAVIQQHGGSIRIESEKRQGTQVIVDLPFKFPQSVHTKTIPSGEPR